MAQASYDLRNIVVPTADQIIVYDKFALHREIAGLIAFGNGAGLTGVTNHAMNYCGFAASPSSRSCASFSSQDAVADAVVLASTQNNFLARLYGPAGGVGNDLDVNLMSERNHFTGDWEDTTYPSALSAAGIPLGWVSLLAFAGIRFEPFNFALPGNTSNFSTAGLGFKPNFIMLATGLNTLGGISQNQAFCTGWATDRTQQCCGFSDRNGAATSTNRRWQRTDRVFQAYLASGGAARIDLSLVSFNDNETITFNDAAGLLTSVIYGVAMYIPNGVHLTTFTARIGAGTQVLTSCPFRPSAVMMMTWCRAASASVQAHATYCMGMAVRQKVATSGVKQSSSWVGCQNAQATMNTDQANYVGCLNESNFDAEGALAYLSSFNENGITLEYINGGGEHEILLCYLGHEDPNVKILGGNIQGGIIGG